MQQVFQPNLLRSLLLTALFAVLLFSIGAGSAGTALAQDDVPELPLMGDARVMPLPEGAAGAAPGGAPPALHQTSVFMIGTVTVQPILIEASAGGESWNSTEQTNVKNEIRAGLDWWEDTASTYGFDGVVSFNVLPAKKRSINLSWEPIKGAGFLTSSDELIWIDKVMDGLGYNGDLFSVGTRVRQYNHDLRTKANTDWAYTIFVVDSSNDSKNGGDGRFSDGSFAWAYYNGPYMVMTYDNNGWGIDRMDMVTAHETGHIFGALDEYYGPCNVDEWSGYLVAQNTNCEDEFNDAAEHSIMRYNVSQEIAYPSHITSTPNRKAIGWYDTDADFIPDPIDDLTITLDPIDFNPMSAWKINRTGTAETDAWRYNDLNTWTTDCDGDPGFDVCTLWYDAVNINEISTVEFYDSLTSTDWQDAVGGSYGSETTNYWFATGAPIGEHLFTVRVVDQFGNMVETSDSVTVSSNPPPTEILQNGGFETDSNLDLLPDLWVKGNLQLSGTKDGIDTVVFHTGGPGAASFRIKGNNKGKKVSQLIAGPVGPAGDEFLLRFFVSQDNVPSGGTYSVQVVFTYTDGSKGKFTYVLPDGTDLTWQEYTILSISGIPIKAAKPYKKIQLLFNYKKSGGTIWLDDVSLGRLD
jgi:hypothetical protein